MRFEQMSVWMKAQGAASDRAWREEALMTSKSVIIY